MLYTRVDRQQGEQTGDTQLDVTCGTGGHSTSLLQKQNTFMLLALTVIVTSSSIPSFK